MNANPSAAASTVLRLEGRDVLDLLHRISTADLRALERGAARATLFCDFRGRIQHRATVVHAPDGAVWLLRPDAPGDALAAFLDRSVFREDVRIANAGDGWRVEAHYDRDTAGQPVVEWRDAVPGSVELPLGERLLVRPADAGASEEADAREFGRIARLLPRDGHELRDAFTPYDVGLAREVHLSKGCYTGQETLLRLVTYESARRALARVTLPGGPAAPLAAVLAGGERAGEITSVARRSRDGEFSALAVMRRDAATPGAALALENGAPVRVDAVREPERPPGLPA